MKLHFDRDTFSALLHLVSDNTDIRADVFEKDYYITLLLKELSEWQDTLPAYFKGGTALYKALHSIRRFSEDIDLTVCIDDCSNSQAKRRLEKAANGYSSLPRTKSKALESNSRGSITSVYDYESVLGAVLSDPLQRFSHVKVEATSFTVSEPFAPLTVVPLLFDKADGAQKVILKNRYEVVPFEVNTIRLERIFTDKIFAAEFYYLRANYFDVAKHIYDIAIMSELEVIRQLIDNPAEMKTMISYKRREEEIRIGSTLSDKPLSEFSIIREAIENDALREAYVSMQDIYIFDPDDRVDFSKAITTFSGVMKEIIDA